MHLHRYHNHTNNNIANVHNDLERGYLHQKSEWGRSSPSLGNFCISWILLLLPTDSFYRCQKEKHLPLLTVTHYLNFFLQSPSSTIFFFLEDHTSTLHCWRHHWSGSVCLSKVPRWAHKMLGRKSSKNIYPIWAFLKQKSVSETSTQKVSHVETVTGKNIPQMMAFCLEKINEGIVVDSVLYCLGLWFSISRQILILGFPRYWNLRSRLALKPEFLPSNYNVLGWSTIAFRRTYTFPSDVTVSRCNPWRLRHILRLLLFSTLFLMDTSIVQSQMDGQEKTDKIHFLYK